LLAPELFDVDEAGRGSVRVELITPELADQAHVAASRCPEQAVVMG
jgi:ferredoxin